MRQNRFVEYVILGFLVLVSACSTPPDSTTSSSRWEFDDQGWALKKDENNKSRRFFAIGTWHVPGYTFTKTPYTDSLSYETNKTSFAERTGPFNMVFVSAGYQKDYMSEKIHILNPFSPILHGYLDRLPLTADDGVKDYYKSQYLKKEVGNPAFIQYLDSQIVQLLENLPNDKYIYSHIDEIALGGVSKWAVPPSVGALITERLKKYDQDALVFVDLVGHSKGSTYLFEKRHLQTHDTLPEDPPFELVPEAARHCKFPLLGFSMAHDGTPVYEFSDGNYSYTKHDPDSLRKIWVKNTEIIARDYQGSGDVFGINAFRDFYAQPVLAGLTVDALRAGLGESVPLWLYFDGNGYARPANVTIEAYLLNVKCQIYTSIIHGATGILFWNDWSKTPEVFTELIPVMNELNSRLKIVEMDTFEKRIEGDMHIAVKGSKRGEKYVIATNTSKTEIHTFSLPDGSEMALAPLETYVSPLP